MLNLSLNPQLTYFLGARHKVGDYVITDDETGEVKRSGTTDKWRLFFTTAVDSKENNVKENFGMCSVFYDVKGDDLCYLFCQTSKEFNLDDFKGLVGQPVLLDFSTSINSKGVQITTLRGMKSLSSFLSSMTSDNLDNSDKSSKSSK